MWLLLAAVNEASPAVTNPVDWLTYIGTVAPVTGVLLYAWLQEYKAHHADNLAKDTALAAKDTEIQRLNDQIAISLNSTLPVLTRAVEALQDVRVEKRNGR